MPRFEKDFFSFARLKQFAVSVSRIFGKQPWRGLMPCSAGVHLKWFIVGNGLDKFGETSKAV